MIRDGRGLSCHACSLMVQATGSCAGSPHTGTHLFRSRSPLAAFLPPSRYGISGVFLRRVTAWPGCRAGWTFPASDGPYVAHRREAKGILFAPWPLERSNCPNSTSILLIFGGLSYGVNLMPCRKLRHQQPLTGLEPALRLIKTALSPGKLQRHMPPAGQRRNDCRPAGCTKRRKNGKKEKRKR